MSITIPLSRLGHPFGQDLGVDTFAELAAGFGVGTATAWRYVNEVVELLAARAPKLRKAVRDAKKARYAYVVLDGTLIPIDRLAADRPFYSGKHKKHGMNLQVIASPDGGILWASGPLPGAVHDKRAEWTWGVLRELEAAGLIVLADKGYQGSTYAKVPYKGKEQAAIPKDANTAHAKLRSPRRARERPPCQAGSKAPFPPPAGTRQATLTTTAGPAVVAAPRRRSRAASRKPPPANHPRNRQESLK